jgi:hypothetical protein
MLKHLEAQDDFDIQRVSYLMDISAGASDRHLYVSLVPTPHLGQAYARKMAR